jgi:hypothetical protein
VPDIQADLLRCAINDDIAWVEWRWHGTRVDQTPLEMQGVTIMGIRNNRIVWGRLFMEAVEQESKGIDASVADLTKGS